MKFAVKTHSNEQVDVSVSPSHKIPLYHQVFLVLKSKINDGEYRPGDYLPSERDLSDIFKVSRITTMRALNELAAEGLVVRETGRGTRVRFAAHGLVMRGPPGGEGSHLWPEGGGGPVAINLAVFDYQPATPAVAEALRINVGSPVQHAVRVLAIDGEPFAQLTTYVAAEIGCRFGAQDLASRPLHQILGELGYAIKQVDETVTATLADMTLAQQLKLTAGAPVIKILRTTYADTGTPIERMIGLYRPDRYRYQVSLTDSAVPAQRRLS